jgi:hypothetical protein
MIKAGLVLGSVVLDVDGGRVDAAFLDSSGVVRDHYTVEKSIPAVVRPQPPMNLRVD